MGLTLLDSSALIGYLDADDALHAAAVQQIEAALRDGSRLAISAITWTEVLSGAKQGHHDEATIRGFIEDVGVAVMGVDQAVAEAAAELQADYARTGRKKADRPKLRTPDALILATAVAHEDVDSVITGERKWELVPNVPAAVEVLAE